MHCLISCSTEAAVIVKTNIVVVGSQVCVEEGYHKWHLTLINMFAWKLDRKDGERYFSVGISRQNLQRIQEDREAAFASE